MAFRIPFHPREKAIASLSLVKIIIQIYTRFLNTNNAGVFATDMTEEFVGVVENYPSMKRAFASDDTRFSARNELRSENG